MCTSDRNCGESKKSYSSSTASPGTLFLLLLLAFDASHDQTCFHVLVCIFPFIRFVFMQLFLNSGHNKRQLKVEMKRTKGAQNATKRTTPHSQWCGCRGLAVAAAKMERHTLTCLSLLQLKEQRWNVDPSAAAAAVMAVVVVVVQVQLFRVCNMHCKWIISSDNHLTWMKRQQFALSKTVRATGPKVPNERGDKKKQKGNKKRETRSGKGSKSVRGLIKEHPNETCERQGECEIARRFALRGALEVKRQVKKCEEKMHKETHILTLTHTPNGMLRVAHLIQSQMQRVMQVMQSFTPVGPCVSTGQHCERGRERERERKRVLLTKSIREWTLSEWGNDKSKWQWMQWTERERESQSTRVVLHRQAFANKRLAVLFAECE